MDSKLGKQELVNYPKESILAFYIGQKPNAGDGESVSRLREMLQ